ncbi:hypothetical protein FA13DRAFT_816406 [Coprinellus micaceus]|uniref:Uncharacterized protein n=1 Tax=Coprinellus micaceus TaxID=71717 RepID=A0A4Y7T233_COPMI|nr:hypothetical protein FA13DRAFT_816406 [Coprinellus micaceus]
MGACGAPGAGSVEGRRRPSRYWAGRLLPPPRRFLARGVHRHRHWHTPRGHWGYTVTRMRESSIHRGYLRWAITWWSRVERLGCDLARRVPATARMVGRGRCTRIRCIGPREHLLGRYGCRGARRGVAGVGGRIEGPMVGVEVVAREVPELGCVGTTRSHRRSRLRGRGAKSMMVDEKLWRAGRKL